MSGWMEGYGTHYVTLQAESPIEPGRLVNFAGPYQVATASEGEVPMGMAVSQRGELCLVQLSGPVTVPYTGFAPTYGESQLAVTAAGGVQEDADNGRWVKVLAVDTVKRLVTFLL